MITSVSRWWERFWFSPGPRSTFIFVRCVVSLQALWIVLSRPDWPALSLWPVPHDEQLRILRLRFGIGLLPASGERLLWAMLILALSCVLLGRLPRVAAALAVLLLIHFGPFDDVLVGMPFTGVDGLTTAVLALTVFAAAEAPRRHDGPSWRWRWPVAAVELFVALIYPMSFLAKIHYAGPGWYAPENLRLIASRTGGLYRAPWSHMIAGNSTMALLVAGGTLLLETGFIAVLMWRPSRWFFIPLAILAAWLRVKFFGLYFLEWPLLLVFFPPSISGFVARYVGRTTSAVTISQVNVSGGRSLAPDQTSLSQVRE